MICHCSNRSITIFFAAWVATLALVACGGKSGPANPSPTSDAVTITLWADQSSIASGATTVVHWTSTNSTSCVSSGGGGSDTSGSFTTPALFAAATYTVTCTGTNGASTSQTVTVYIGSGCTSTESDVAGAISLSNVPSRLSGVAPLAVFFDASGSSATATTRPFHDLEYRWDFGDKIGGILNLSPPLTGTSTWNAGSKPGVSSRNTATGPVTAHVYETPGTYYVTLNITDGTNSVSNSCTEIAVQDPDTVFATTNTVCVARTAGFAGCPAGAQQITETSFPAAISNYAKTGTRVLFKRGDTFDAATEAVLTETGPGMVGAFGTGALPVIQMTGNTNVLGFSSVTTPDFKDWRIMDLDMDGMGGNATSGTGIGGTSGGAAQITVLRLTYRNMNNAIGFAIDLLNYWNNYADANSRPDLGGHMLDQVAVVDSTVVAGANTVYSAYDSGNRIAFMGNSFDNGGNASGSHVTRWPYLNKAVISNNSFSRPGFTRLTIKLHGPGWNAVSNDGVFDPTATHPRNGPSDWSNYSLAASGDGYSKYVVISDNKLTEAANPWSVDIGPEDPYNDERVHDVIFERNWFVANTASQVSLRIAASEITVRNNVHDFSNGSNGQTSVVITKDGITPAPDQLRVYNNTFYSSYAVPNGQFVGVQIDNSVTNVTARNNLAYAPNAINPLMFLNSCGACLTQSNNSTDSQITIASPPISTTDWAPASASYAIGGGVTVPVWSDYYRNSRPLGTLDIGAVEVP